MKIFGLVIAKEIYMPIFIIIVAFVLNKTINTIIKKVFNPKKSMLNLIREK